MPRAGGPELRLHGYLFLLLSVSACGGASRKRRYRDEDGAFYDSLFVRHSLPNRSHRRQSLHFVIHQRPQNVEREFSIACRASMAVQNKTTRSLIYRLYTSICISQQLTFPESHVDAWVFVDADDYSPK
jgi:hypothetical protein